MKERTDFVHNIHVVHVVSLPQVEGQLWGKEKEASAAILLFMLVRMKVMERLQWKLYASFTDVSCLGRSINSPLHFRWSS